MLYKIVFYFSLVLCCAAYEQPNIVFIFTDDHATQSIGAYGSKINKTPNIDRIADEGAVFLNSFCANSICGPSRACILTGKPSDKRVLFAKAYQENVKSEALFTLHYFHIFQVE